MLRHFHDFNLPSRLLRLHNLHVRLSHYLDSNALPSFPVLGLLDLTELTLADGPLNGIEFVDVDLTCDLEKPL